MNIVNKILDWADPYWSWSNLWKLILWLFVLWVVHSALHMM